MSSDDRMSIDERRKYLKLVAPRYVQAGRVERGRLLSEMVAVTGLHRKSLIRLLCGRTLERAARKPRVRRRRYGAAVAVVVRVVWESLDYVCAERVTPVLLSTAQHLARWGEVVLTPERLKRHWTASAEPPCSGCCSVSRWIVRGCPGESHSHPIDSCEGCPWGGYRGKPGLPGRLRWISCTTADW